MRVKCVIGDPQANYPIFKGRVYEVDKTVRTQFSRGKFYHLAGQPEFVQWSTRRFEVLSE